MNNKIWCILGLSVIVSAGEAAAQTAVIDDDFSSGTISENNRFRLDQVDLGWYKEGESLWRVNNGVLTNACTTAGVPSEGPVGQSVSTAALDIGLDLLTVSFDYTVGEGSTLYFHLIGMTTNGTPVANEHFANTGASDGCIYNPAEIDFGDLSLLTGNDPGDGVADTVSFTATSGTYTATFDLSEFAWSVDESPGLAGAIASATDFDFILAAFGINTDNALNSGVSVDNFLITLESSESTTVVTSPDEFFEVVPEGSMKITNTVELVYSSDSNLDIAVSVVDQNPANSFNVLSASPQTLSNPYPGSATLEIEFDNSTANLIFGQTATGQVAIAWSESGSTDISTHFIPISVFYGPAPGEENRFVGTVSSDWSIAANWDGERIPGDLVADLAVIDEASVVHVTSNYTANYAWETVVKGEASLNIAADLLGGGDLSVGSDGEAGTVTQTAGSAGFAALNVSDAAAASDSMLHLSGGEMETSGLMNIHAGGVLKVTGGTITVASSIAENSIATTLESGAVIEISGGTYLDTSRIEGPADSTIRIVGEAADITLHQLYQAFDGRIEFVLGDTGVSTLKNDSWGGLEDLTFVIDGAGYGGAPQEILLYTGGWNYGPLESDYMVTNLGEEGSDWEIIETTNTPHTVTLKIFADSPYAGWAASYNLTGVDAEETMDYDGDKLDNLREYALGGNPTNALDQGYVPTYGISGEYFEYVYARRLGDSNLTYTAEFGTDLVYTNWDSSVVTELPITGSLTNGFESVTNRVDMTGKDTGFMQLLIESL